MGKNRDGIGKGLEQRLYEAYQAGAGIRLTAEEVESLVHDDAIGTRITNEACIQGGVDEMGVDSIGSLGHPQTWKALVAAVRVASGLEPQLRRRSRE